MKFHLACLGVVLLFWAVGCGQEPAPPVLRPVRKVAPPPSAETAPAAAATEHKPFAPDVASTAMAPFQKDLESKSANDNLRALNEAITFWMASGRPFPKDLNELVAGKLITRLPPPPPGKQFLLDPSGMRVTLSP